MAITDFALDYQKQVILNYAQMHEVNKAIAARLVVLFSKISSDQYNEDDEKDYDRESIQILVSVSRILDPLIEQAVLEYEAQIAKNESKHLDDPEKLRKFLKDD